MPSAGARSGTKPSRSGRGAGDGRVGVTIALVCGHHVGADARAIATKAGGRRMFRCLEGCSLQLEKA